MKNKKDILPIIIASVIALLITILVRFLLPGGTLMPVKASQNSEITMPKIPLIMKGEAAKEVQVLCVSTKIAKGHKIQSDQLSWKKWPEDALQPYYIAKSANGNPLNNGADYSNALKMWAVSDIPAGIPLTMQMLTDEDPAKKAAEALKAQKEQHAKDEAKKAAELKKIEQEKAKNTIAKGMRAVTFNVNQQSAVSTGMMKVGDYVDIIIMQQQNGQTVTHKYNALKILAIDGASETKQEKKGILGNVSSLGGIFSPRNITLEVQANLVNIMISQAANNGVIVSLRNQDEEKEKQQAQAEEKPQEEISEDQISKGMRAVTFAVNQQSAVSTSMMKVGDYVDIVIMQQQNGQNVTRKYSSLKILAIDGITGTRSAKKGTVENAGPVTVPRNITLEIPVDRVDEMIAQATNSGVIISLRNQDEEDQQPQANSETEEESFDEYRSNEKTAELISKGMRAVTFNVNQQSSVSTSMMKVGNYVDIIIMQQQEGQTLTHKYSSLKILAIDGVTEPKANGKNEPITFPRNITLEVPVKRVNEMIAQATTSGVIVSLRNQEEQEQAEASEEEESDQNEATAVEPITKGMRAVTFAVNQQSAVSTSMMKVGDYVDVVIMQQQNGQNVTRKYSALKILAIDGIAGGKKGPSEEAPVTFPRNITLEVAAKRVDEMLTQAANTGIILSLRNQEEEQNEAQDGQSDEEQEQSAARDVLLKNIASMNRSTSAELMKDIKQRQETEQKHMDELINNIASIGNRQFKPAFKQQSKGEKKSGSRMEMVSGKVVGEEQMPEPVKINIYKTGQPVETIQIEQ